MTHHQVTLAVLALAACGLTGCSQVENLDAIAAAKCSLPVVQRLQPGGHNGDGETFDVHDAPGTPTGVRLLSNGNREVTGTVTYHGDMHDYTCVVTRDDSDKLRHLRVVHLTVD